MQVLGIDCSVPRMEAGRIISRWFEYEFIVLHAPTARWKYVVVLLNKDCTKIIIRLRRSRQGGTAEVCP